MSKSTAYIYSYLVAFLYVGLGTLSILSMYPDNLLFGEWVMWGVLVTLPVNFIGWGILYSDPNQHGIVILVQILVFILVGLLFFRVLFKRYITRR
ncbi:hypothetical protein [Chitinophaga sp. OAE865]|uniref:hypothetical protein n=1 Tax=Chitinophaga sp. OAE865 TaxID=2817898 RepID=UPI001AEAC923